MRFKPSYLAWMLILTTVGGCAATKVKDPITPTVSKIADPTSAQLTYWHGITDLPVVCNDDAFHGVLLFLDDKDKSDNYAARVAELKSRKLIPQGFNGASDDAVNRGVMAYAFSEALHIRGGWVLTVFGNSERYALRELMNMNLFPRSSPEQTFTGSEFVGIIGRVEDYQDGESAFIPAQTLPAAQPGD